MISIVVIHKENGGVVKARQIGVAAANGEYVAFADGDDWIAEDYFSDLVDIIKKYEPDCICFDYYLAHENAYLEKHIGRREGFYNRKELENLIFPTLISSKGEEGVIGSLWSKIFKRSVYTCHQLKDTVVVMGEDTACSIAAMANSNSFYMLSKCLYYYRYNPASVTYSKKAYPWDGPMIRGQHLEEHINMDEHGFRQQLCWHVVYSLFTVAISQFRTERSYLDIRKDIIFNLNTPYYQNALKGCRSRKNKKDIFVLNSLKFKMVFLLKCYYKYSVYMSKKEAKQVDI